MESNDMPNKVTFADDELPKSLHAFQNHKVINISINA